MNTKSMNELKETLCENLEQYSRKDNLTRNDLDTVHMLTDTIKNIEKISMMEEEGYSYGEGRWDANGSYSNGMPMSYGRRSGRRNSYGDERMNYSGEGGDMEYRMRREMNY